MKVKNCRNCEHCIRKVWSSSYKPLKLGGCKKKRGKNEKNY